MDGCGPAHIEQIAPECTGAAAVERPMEPHCKIMRIGHHGERGYIKLERDGAGSPGLDCAEPDCAAPERDGCGRAAPAQEPGCGSTRGWARG